MKEHGLPNPLARVDLRDGSMPPRMRHQPSGHRYEHLIAAALLLGIAVAFFTPALFGNRMFSAVPGYQNAVYPWAASRNRQPFPVQSDQAELTYPWHILYEKALRSGTLPFWNAKSFGGGYPLFANGSSGQLSPVRYVLSRTFGPVGAHELSTLLYLALGGIFAYALLRELGAGLLGGLLSGVAWELSGFNTAWMHLEVVTPMLVYVPLGVLCVRRAWRLDTWRSRALASVVLGLTLVSGHILWLGITFGIASLYAVALGAWSAAWSWHRRGGLRRTVSELIKPAAVILGGLGLASVVVLPTLLALQSTSRARLSYRDMAVTIHVEPWSNSWSFISAMMIGQPTPLTVKGIQLLPFIGGIAALFAAVGFCTRRPGAALGRWITVVLFLCVIGGPVAWFMATMVPGMNVFRPYTRFSGWWVFGAALLAGQGLDHVLGRVRRIRLPSWRLPGGVAVDAAAILGLLAVVCTGAQLGVFARRANPPFAPRDAAMVFPETDLIRAIRAASRGTDTWPERVLPIRRGEAGDDPSSWYRPMLYGNTPLVHDLDTGMGYDSTLPARTANVLRILSGEPLPSVLANPLHGAFIPQYRTGALRYELLERLGYSLVAAPPQLPEGWGNDSWRAIGAAMTYDGADGTLYSLNADGAGPRFATNLAVVASDNEALRRFVEPTFPFRSTVLLTTGEERRLPQRWREITPAGPGTARGEVENVRWGINTLNLATRSATDALLVMPNWWDAGWSATIDGRSAPVLRGNYNQQVLPIPAGLAKISLLYRPPGFAAGALVSAGAAAALLLVAIGSTTGGWRRRRTPHPGVKNLRNAWCRTTEASGRGRNSA